MTKTIKLIWDFRGSDARPIAEHHATHLREYVQSNDQETLIIGIKEISPLHCIAYMNVPETGMKDLRDALRPHRGEFVDVE